MVGTRPRFPPPGVILVRLVPPAALVEPSAAVSRGVRRNDPPAQTPEARSRYRCHLNFRRLLEAVGFSSSGRPRDPPPPWPDALAQAAGRIAERRWHFVTLEGAPMAPRPRRIGVWPAPRQALKRSAARNGRRPRRLRLTGGTLHGAGAEINSLETGQMTLTSPVHRPLPAWIVPRCRSEPPHPTDS